MQTALVLESQLANRVVDHIRAKIEEGVLKPGDKIHPEREFARSLNISRSSLRTGIGFLTAMGVLEVRHRVGTYVARKSATFGRITLDWMGALHGFNEAHLLEARKLLESNLAALAAVRGRDEHFMLIAEELAEMYATVDEPEQYLIHDVCFHRSIAEAACNPVLSALMNTISAAFYETRRNSTGEAAEQKRSIEEHREIYRMIRARNPKGARMAMESHLHFSPSANPAVGIPSHLLECAHRATVGMDLSHDSMYL
jgi:GntR family transcriptional repressor for pyruvate dehydrogenase complex